MSDPFIPTPLFVLFVATAIVTLEMACGVAIWHAIVLRRAARNRGAGDALALEFARFLCEGLDPDRLRALVRKTRSGVFWAAVESFSDGIQGEQWSRLSAELRDLPEVARARADLGHPGSWVRARAARRLGMLEDRGPRDALFRAMKRGPREVSLSAALALARLGDLPSLEWLLLHPEILTGLSRMQLQGLIRRFGPAAVEPMRRVAAAGSTEAPLQLAALDALGHFRDEGSRAPLERLLAGGELESRIAAARALGLIAHPDSVTPLAHALRDPAWQVRALAARSLGSYGPAGAPAIPALVARTRDLSWWVRRNAAFSLGRFGFRGQAALATVAGSDTDPYARGAAREVLQAIEWEAESPGGVTRVE